MRFLLAPSGPLAAWLERLAAMQAIERGVVLGAQAFGTLIPLLIAYSAVVPLVEARDFAGQIIDRLKLTGAAAQSMREAVAPSSTVAQSLTVLGFVLVVVSALSLARALQRVYELSYDLPAVGIRGTHWQLLWIALIPIYVTLRPLITEFGSGWWRVTGSLLLGMVAWLATPYALLGRRLAWRRLFPGAVVTAVSMTILSGASLVYLPHSVSSSAEQYGTIGVAFSMLSWLILAGLVIVGSAAAGAVALRWIEERK